MSASDLQEDGSYKRDWGKGTVPIRQRLLRRIREGKICGYPLAEGRACLGTPSGPGQYCDVHLRFRGGSLALGVGNNVKHGATASKETTLAMFLQRNLSPEDAKILLELKHLPDNSVDDLILWARLRMYNLVRRFAEGYVLRADYDKGARLISEEIRTLLKTKQELELTEAQLRKVRLGDDDTPDAYDPVRDAQEDGEE